jgi:hypothetical protein
MWTKALLTALFAATVAAGNIDLNTYTFEKYLSDFGLKFHPSELDARRATFSTELARVKAHNAKNLSWKESMNKHSVLSASEKKAFKGRHKGAARQHGLTAKSLPPDFEMKPVSMLPQEVDWRTKGINCIFFLYIFVTFN